MGDINKQICRLCLLISPTCEYIDEIKKEILQVLQINMDFDVSNCAVACNRCLERLQDCFDFKSCIITTLMDEIKKTSQKDMIGESLCLEKFQGCRLCMSLIKEKAYNYTTDLKGAVLLEDMIRNCFPEVDLNPHVHESHICKQCVKSLERHYEFMKCCQEVEQTILHFRQVTNDCTADKVNLEDLLKFKDYDMLGTPLVIKKECSDAENIDENAKKCPKSEDIASIKCEEIHIKDELDNGTTSTDYNSSEDSMSSKEVTETRASASKGQKYSCHKCHYSSDRIDNMQRHMLTHSDNEVRGCTLCSFITNTRLSLQAHMASHRGSIKRYGCSECIYEADQKYKLRKHFLKHKDNSEVKMYKCDLCPLKSRYKDVLIKHQKVLHKDPQEIPNHKCEMCNFETKYKKNLVTHMWIHEDPKVANKFQCETCSYRTKWKSGFKKHVMTHHIDHLYSCDQCSYSSNMEHNLRRHQLRHADGAGQNKCKLCTYRARTARSIRIHMINTHTDPSKVPKLKCAHCPYETVYKDYLLKHIRRGHRNEDQPKLKCDLCNYVTTEKSNLQRHVIVHREAIMQCYQCNFQTKWKHCLRNHMKLHQAGSASPTKQQTYNMRSYGNRNIKKKKKNNNKKRV